MPEVTTTPGGRLAERLATGELLVLPGAANALTARVIEDCGFDAAYVTGAGVANTFLGAPDIALLPVTELVDHVAAMASAVDIPLVVDADTGFGGPLNVARTVRALERAGRIVVLEPDLAYAISTYRDLVARALALAADAPLTPAAYRDATGTSRKYVMAILEDLDRRGILRRTPDGHVAGPKASVAVGR